MQNHKILKAKKTDYDLLIILWEASVNATHHFLTQKDIQQYKLLIYEYYFQQLEIFFVKREGNIAGFIGLKKDFIQMLFFAPGEMRKGIGNALIEYAIKHRNAKSIDVNEQNINAIRFYKKMGFEITGRTETDAVGKPYPVISMKLNSSLK
ncbi:GNAT family N-acetyltransferase [Pedobacter jejuensis]|uniref:GNAT family N-acetyltransferase n=1 Tax=Pedobacter jejuensis TaxID=1268550 RepID=A0A3N0C0P8_9SPHI|nr:GNAT family N-acetyltransferase [Pedobacter jejuensis]RNL55762.1 GNAT family N-acetyltransferase [Pedobacter jejuensis]